MSENPFKTPEEASQADGARIPENINAVNATYNVVTDTLTGVNVRWSDNKFQAIFVFVSLLVVALIGAVLAAVNTSWGLPWYGGALAGAFIGLILGVFASGIFLMCFRAIRHLKG
ncbi:MAG: hypothetical protein ACK55I_38200, partial [bacterium]